MILNYSDFINEGYLKGGRHLLYHYTYRLSEIIEDDTLKVSKPVMGDDAICFTRSPYFEEHSKDVRFVLDSDLLKRDGIRVYPIDEVAMSAGKSGLKHLKGYTKANPHFTGRKTIHNTKLKQDLKDTYGGLEWEYEERCFKDIKNLGKYVVAIDLTERVMTGKYKELKEYLDKYPHIELFKLNMDKLYDRRDKIDFDKFYQESVEKYSKPRISRMFN